MIPVLTRQRVHFFFLERPVLPYFELADRDGADRGAHQLPHAAAYLLDHPPHLAIAALGDDHLERSLVLILPEQMHLGRTRGTFIQLHPRAQLLQLLLAQLARRFHQVSLRHLVVRIHNALGKLRIVGQDQQTAGVQIQPSHRNHVLRQAADQIVDRRPAFRVLIRRQVAFGLVEQNVFLLGCLDGLAVKRYGIPFEIHPLIGSLRGAAVHLHPAGRDPFAGLGPRTDSGFG